MNTHESWEKALKNTEILRSRIQELSTFSDTQVPYILLSESLSNHSDTVVRKGEILVQKPSIILPPHLPQFLGFDFQKEKEFETENIMNFLLVRGVELPSLKYQNKTFSLNLYDGSLSKAIDHFTDDLQKQEDVRTGLMAGPEDCWQFSVLIFICGQVAKNSDADIRRLMQKYKKENS